jgi:hypothetical protein
METPRLYEYVSPKLDSNIDNIDTLEAVRREEVEEALEYFDAIREPLTYQLQDVLGVMERRKANPYADLRLPESAHAVSIADLEDLIGRIANAYMTYGEYLSAVLPMLAMRENLYERRKARMMTTKEGGNEQERKGLASMRSEPEFLLKTKVEMLHRFVSTRYFTYKAMLDAAQQMLTTKSVERSRKNAEEATEKAGY